ncbi:MAG TPA: type II secretion system F family protein [Tepidisphaeraceae bacterium]|nr:type II secretion system F family protein [Tepidisphaeraceae bacterium]
MAYQYKAIDMTGKQVEDRIDSSGSLADAGEELRRRGLFVIEIRAAAASSVQRQLTWRDRLSGGKRLSQVAAFLRQLSVLMASGTPLVQALGALERQTPDPRFRTVIQQLRSQVEQGEPLAGAMQAQPTYFDPVCRGLIAAGESGGNFNQILDRLAGMLRQQVQVRSSLIGAMIYPSLLLSVSVGVLVLMVGFVLPRFEGMFDTLGTDMPLPTKLLLGLGNWFNTYWWIPLSVLVIGAVIGYRWAQTPTGRHILHSAAVTTPVLAKVVRSFCTARVARVLGMLLTSRVPLNEALTLTRDVAGNERFAAAIDQAGESITSGGTLSAALLGSGLFAPTVCEAIHSGEQAGRLGDLLIMVADYLDEENAATLKTTTAMIEPVILIGVGTLVGGVVLSMFLPLFDVAASAGGGS